MRATSRSLRFGPFVLDQARGDLWRDVAPVEIQATPLRLLRYLAEHPGELVSHDELLEHAWDGVVVSDNAIAAALKQVRLSIDDRDRDPPWIQTLRGRGIRFNAAVEAVAGERDTAAIATRAPFGRAALRALGIAAASLAATAVVLTAVVWLAWPAPLVCSNIWITSGAEKTQDPFLVRPITGIRSTTLEDEGSAPVWREETKARK